MRIPGRITIRASAITKVGYVSRIYQLWVKNIICPLFNSGIFGKLAQIKLFIASLDNYCKLRGRQGHLKYILYCQQ